jgi:hypothetical protein
MATGQAPFNPVPAVRTYLPVEHPVVVVKIIKIKHKKEARILNNLYIMSA